MMKHVLIILLSLLAGMYVLPAQTILVFDRELHFQGDTVYKEFVLPSDISLVNFDQILMHVQMNCSFLGCGFPPNTGKIFIRTDSMDVEIARYVTPGAINNCGFTLDVSDYRNLLSDSVQFVSHIETPQNAWDISMELEYVLGSPPFPYISVYNLWDEPEFNYGDTLVYSNDLPDRKVAVPGNADKVVFRVTHTGHGQGNTGNAAEFLRETHYVKVNDIVVDSVDLWREDCADNPCSPQAGQWQLPRAGWCPGQGVIPTDIDISHLAIPGSGLVLDYELAPYFNRCSPFNPDCGTMICPNCNFNGGGHTPPVLNISGQLLFYANEPLWTVSTEADISLPELHIEPNPSTGLFDVRIQSDHQNGNLTWRVWDIQGKILQHGTKATAKDFFLDLSTENSGLYLLEVQWAGHSLYKRLSKI